jgi:hypothetical protein
MSWGEDRLKVVHTPRRRTYMRGNSSGNTLTAREGEMAHKINNNFLSVFK